MQTKDINTAVADSLAGAGNEIKTRVINMLKEAEVDRRASALHKAVTKVRDLNKDLQKLKPDHETFDDKGAKITSGYTKPKLDERNKLIAEIEKYEKAIGTATTEQPDFGDLFNLTK
jgi:hypothetical protein